MASPFSLKTPSLPPVSPQGKVSPKKSSKRRTKPKPKPKPSTSPTPEDTSPPSPSLPPAASPPSTKAAPAPTATPPTSLPKLPTPQQQHTLSRDQALARLTAAAAASPAPSVDALLKDALWEVQGMFPGCAAYVGLAADRLTTVHFTAATPNSGMMGKALRRGQGITFDVLDALAPVWVADVASDSAAGLVHLFTGGSSGASTAAALLSGSKPARKKSSKRPPPTAFLSVPIAVGLMPVGVLSVDGPVGALTQSLAEAVESSTGDGAAARRGSKYGQHLPPAPPDANVAFLDAIAHLIAPALLEFRRRQSLERLETAAALRRGRLDAVFLAGMRAVREGLPTSAGETVFAALPGDAAAHPEYRGVFTDGAGRRKRGSKVAGTPLPPPPQASDGAVGYAGVWYSPGAPSSVAREAVMGPGGGARHGYPPPNTVMPLLASLGHAFPASPGMQQIPKGVPAGDLSAAVCGGDSATLDAAGGWKLVVVPLAGVCVEGHVLSLTACLPPHIDLPDAQAWVATIAAAMSPALNTVLEGMAARAAAVQASVAAALQAVDDAGDGPGADAAQFQVLVGLAVELFPDASAYVGVLQPRCNIIRYVAGSPDSAMVGLETVRRDQPWVPFTCVDTCTPTPAVVLPDGTVDSAGGSLARMDIGAGPSTAASCVAIPVAAGAETATCVAVLGMDRQFRMPRGGSSAIARAKYEAGYGDHEVRVLTQVAAWVGAAVYRRRMRSCLASLREAVSSRRRPTKLDIFDAGIEAVAVLLPHAQAEAVVMLDDAALNADAEGDDDTQATRRQVRQRLGKDLRVEAVSGRVGAARGAIDALRVMLRDADLNAALRGVLQGGKPLAMPGGVFVSLGSGFDPRPVGLFVPLLGDGERAGAHPKRSPRSVAALEAVQAVGSAMLDVAGDVAKDEMSRVNELSAALDGLGAALAAAASELEALALVPPAVEAALMPCNVYVGMLRPRAHTIEFVAASPGSTMTGHVLHRDATAPTSASFRVVDGDVPVVAFLNASGKCEADDGSTLQRFDGVMGDLWWAAAPLGAGDGRTLGMLAVDRAADLPPTVTGDARSRAMFEAGMSPADLVFLRQAAGVVSGRLAELRQGVTEAAMASVLELRHPLPGDVFTAGLAALRQAVPRCGGEVVVGVSNGSMTVVDAGAAGALADALPGFAVEVVNAVGVQQVGTLDGGEPVVYMPLDAADAVKLLFPGDESASVGVVVVATDAADVEVCQAAVTRMGVGLEAVSDTRRQRAAALRASLHAMQAIRIMSVGLGSPLKAAATSPANTTASVMKVLLDAVPDCCAYVGHLHPGAATVQYVHASPASFMMGQASTRASNPVLFAALDAGDEACVLVEEDGEVVGGEGTRLTRHGDARGTVRYLAIPLQDDSQRVLGVLCVDRPVVGADVDRAVRDSAFSEEEMKVLRGCATSLSSDRSVAVRKGATVAIAGAATCPRAGLVDVWAAVLGGVQAVLPFCTAAAVVAADGAGGLQDVLVGRTPLHTKASILNGDSNPKRKPVDGVATASVVAVAAGDAPAGVLPGDTHVSVAVPAGAIAPHTAVLATLPLKAVGAGVDAATPLIMKLVEAGAEAAERIGKATAADEAALEGGVKAVADAASGVGEEPSEGEVTSVLQAAVDAVGGALPGARAYAGVLQPGGAGVQFLAASAGSGMGGEALQRDATAATSASFSVLDTGAPAVVFLRSDGQCQGSAGVTLQRFGHADGDAALWWAAVPVGTVPGPAHGLLAVDWDVPTTEPVTADDLTARRPRDVHRAFAPTQAEIEFLGAAAGAVAGVLAARRRVTALAALTACAAEHPHVATPAYAVAVDGILDCVPAATAAGVVVLPTGADTPAREEVATQRGAGVASLLPLPAAAEAHALSEASTAEAAFDTEDGAQLTVCTLQPGVWWLGRVTLCVVAPTGAVPPGLLTDMGRVLDGVAFEAQVRKVMLACWQSMFWLRRQLGVHSMFYGLMEPGGGWRYCGATAEREKDVGDVVTREAYPSLWVPLDAGAAGVVQDLKWSEAGSPKTTAEVNAGQHVDLWFHSVQVERHRGNVLLAPVVDPRGGTAAVVGADTFLFAMPAGRQFSPEDVAAGQRAAGVASEVLADPSPHATVFGVLIRAAARAAKSRKVATKTVLDGRTPLRPRVMAILRAVLVLLGQEDATTVDAIKAAYGGFDVHGALAAVNVRALDENAVARAATMLRPLQPQIVASSMHAGVAALFAWADVVCTAYGTPPLAQEVPMPGSPTRPQRRRRRSSLLADGVEGGAGAGVVDVEGGAEVPVRDTVTAGVMAARGGVEGK